MPSQHKTPLLGWHPSSAEDAEWIRAEAAKRGKGALSRMLDKALRLLREHDNNHGSDPTAPEGGRQ